MDAHKPVCASENRRVLRKYLMTTQSCHESSHDSYPFAWQTYLGEFKGANLE